MSNIKGILRIVRKIMVGIIAILLLIYLWMFFDTNELFGEIKAEFAATTYDSSQQWKPIDYYNSALNFPKAKGGKVSYFVFRVFTLHSFTDGFVLLHYSAVAKDSNGDMAGGSSNVFSRVDIHKENGKWVIVKIHEHA